MAWYEDFSKDTQNWDEAVFVDFSYPIAFSYRRLRNALSAGEIIGCFSMIKDVFDVKYAIDELGDYDMHIEGCTVRSYSINRTNIRSEIDFSTSISRLFAKTKTDRVESSSDRQLPRITIVSLNPAEDMAYLLNEYRRHHDKLFSQERLLLVIDGIDELQAANDGILNFIPHPSMLDNGVHILLTCRSDGPMPALEIP